MGRLKEFPIVIDHNMQDLIDMEEEILLGNTMRNRRAVEDRVLLSCDDETDYEMFQDEEFHHYGESPFLDKPLKSETE